MLDEESKCKAEVVTTKVPVDATTKDSNGSKSMHGVMEKFVFINLIFSALLVLF